MVDVEIVELLTEGSKEERERAFKQKGEYLYRCVNSVGEEQRQCILLNEYLIKDDKMWLDEQGNPALDLELACRYEKVLEERFYEALLLVKELNNRIIKLCEIMQEKEHPETQYKEGDSEEIRLVKSKIRVDLFGDYYSELGTEIIKRFKNKGCDESFIENYKRIHFLRDNMLYNCRKEAGDARKTAHIKRVNKKIKEVIKEYCKKQNIDEKKLIGKDITDYDRACMKKEARKVACEFVFLLRDWDVQTWMELIFLKFYKVIGENRPRIDIVTEEGKPDIELLNKRKEWIEKESKEWFLERENNYTWQFTEKAVMQLIELEDKDKRLDLMNYTITLNWSMFSEINMIISHSDVDKTCLEMEMGLSGRGLTKRIEHEKVKDMNPYIACGLWKASNVSFERMFQFKADRTTNKDRRVIDAYLQVREPENIYESMSWEMDHLYAKPNRRPFWFMPNRDTEISHVFIELSGSDRIKFTVEFYSMLVDPLVVENPCSGAMKNIVKLKDEKALEIVERAGFETKEQLLKYCAEMVVKNYCKEFLGVPYEVFQRIKCHVDVTIRIQPVVFYQPDGKIQVGYESCFMRNQMTRFGGNGYVELFEKQVWSDREAFEKDWVKRREQIFLILKEKWLEINAREKYYSEYAMQMSDFFKADYVEPCIVDQKDAERLIKRFRTEDTIWC